MTKEEAIKHFLDTHPGEWRFEEFANRGIFAIDVIAESTAWDNDWDEGYPSYIPVYMFTDNDK